jgi:hypothetical protein
MEADLSVGLRTTLILLLLVVAACSGQTQCPGGSEMVDGQCRIIEASRTWDFMLPSSAEVQGLDLIQQVDVPAPLDIPGVDLADSINAETSDAALPQDAVPEEYLNEEIDSD